MVFSSPWSFSRGTILPLKWPAAGDSSVSAWWWWWWSLIMIVMTMMTKIMTTMLMMINEILSVKCPVAWDSSSFSGRKWEARFAPDSESLGRECDKTYIYLRTRSYQSPVARHITWCNTTKCLFNWTDIQLTGAHVLRAGGFVVSLWTKKWRNCVFPMSCSFMTRG